MMLRRYHNIKEEKVVEKDSVKKKPVEEKVEKPKASRKPKADGK